MKKLLLSIAILLLPNLCMSAESGVDISESAELGTAVSGDFIVGGDSSASGAKLRRILLDGDVGKCLSGAGTWIDCVTSGNDIEMAESDVNDIRFLMFSDDTWLSPTTPGYGYLYLKSSDLILNTVAGENTVALTSDLPSEVTVGTHIETFLESADEAAARAAIGAGTGTGGGTSYVATPWTYSDETCTAGQYSFDTGYLYVCVSSGDINRVALTDWNNPQPATGCTADSQIAPSSDVTTTGWNTTDVAYYTEIDNARGAEVTGSYVDEQDDGTSNDFVVRYTLPGDCDVSSLTVYLYGYVNGGLDLDADFSISTDGSTWETNQTVNISAGGEYNSAFTTLSYSAPSYIYVRVQLNESSWNTLYIQNLAIVVNPS